MRLSYSSLNNIHNGHEWLNKTMGIPLPDYPFLREGTAAHRIIQRHVSGVEIHPKLTLLGLSFPVVEEKPFDERCRFSFNVSGGYEVTGFVDGLDREHKRFLEIKTSDTGWSIKQFADSMQRKLYALAFLDFTEAHLITCNADPNTWEMRPPKVFTVQLTQRDRDDAQAWIATGIVKLEAGDFNGGLDENGHCTGCFWNMPKYRDVATCHFL